MTMQQIVLPIQEILEYQNPSLIEDFAKEKAMSKLEANNYFTALKQFFIVCAKNSGTQVPSKAIDEIWHTFLVRSEEYEQFCKEYLGCFVQHISKQHPLPENFDKTVSIAERMFDSIDQKIWKSSGMAECGGCGD